jgi:hypothetical protein
VQNDAGKSFSQLFSAFMMPAQISEEILIDESRFSAKYATRFGAILIYTFVITGFIIDY